jgi:hypothetical protein
MITKRVCYMKIVASRSQPCVNIRAIAERVIAYIRTSRCVLDRILFLLRYCRQNCKRGPDSSSGFKLIFMETAYLCFQCSGGAWGPCSGRVPRVGLMLSRTFSVQDWSMLAIITYEARSSASNTSRLRLATRGNNRMPRLLCK